MPQELEVWYLLPALRRELTKSLIKDFNLKQKKVAEILHLTEPAVSQYLKSKRANEIKFSKQELEIIKKTAQKILKDEKNLQKHLYVLSRKLRGTKTLCELHKKHDKNLPKKCKLCME